jgi:hypothetical protein
MVEVAGSDPPASPQCNANTGRKRMACRGAERSKIMSLLDPEELDHE